jgi:hypothetical protein
MKVEILYIDDCPNWEEAGRRTTAALTAAGHEHVTVTFKRLQYARDTSTVPFAGSPTILVDGADLLPTGTRIADLACRVYSIPDGLAGLPTAGQLVDALNHRGELATDCACCGRSYPRRKLHDVGGTGTLICRRCGVWIALRAPRDRL